MWGGGGGGGRLKTSYEGGVRVAETVRISSYEGGSLKLFKNRHMIFELSFTKKITPKHAMLCNS